MSAKTPSAVKAGFLLTEKRRIEEIQDLQRLETMVQDLRRDVLALQLETAADASALAALATRMDGAVREIQALALRISRFVRDYPQLSFEDLAHLEKAHARLESAIEKAGSKTSPGTLVMLRVVEATLAAS